MWGAVIGDLAGSIYEYEQIKGVKKVESKEIIPDNAFYSDDTILTIAVLDAIMHDKDYEKYLKLYGNKYSTFKPNIEPYFEKVFSPGFIKWCEGEKEGVSTGNGAMMRISPVGYMFNSEKEVKENSKLATIPSHNSKEAIDAAEKVALIIYYARKGFSKNQIIKKLDIELKYKPFEKFNYTCSTTIDNCLYAIYHSDSFEDSIRKVLLMGGDTDTNACIVGSVTEAIYGMTEEQKILAQKDLPVKYTKILKKVYK